MNKLTAWFGLKNQPFEKGIKTKQLVETSALKECAARLDHIKRHGGLMLLTGDPGVGKTVALRRFVDGLNENLYLPLYTPLTTLKRTDLLRHINAKLGLPNKASKSAIYEQIQREILDSREQRGKTVVLIVDEAQLLQTGPLQELRLLTNFRMDSQEPFIIVLAGQSDLSRVMEYSVMEPLAQRFRLRYHMPPLSEIETENYVNHHLKLVGAQEPIFGKGAMKEIFTVSYGIPRRVGSIATQAMFYAMFDNKRTVDAEMVLKVKLGG